MRILFLGGTGLTGPFAVRRLHALGHEVTVYHRGQHEADFPEGVRRVLGDLAHLPGKLVHPAPDVVVHMWAMTEADAGHFLGVFRGVAGRAVVVSSGDVYRAYGRLQRLESGPPDPIPLSEDAPLRESRYPYRKMAPSEDHWMARYEKISIERALMEQTRLPTTILRFPAVCGPNEYRRFQQWLQPMLRGEAEIRVQEDWAGWRWTHGFFEDVAESVVLAATHPRAAGRIYNVGEPQTPTMAERLDAFARASGWRGRIVRAPASEIPEAGRMPHDFAHHLVYDTSRIRTELGYAEAVLPQEALVRIIEWERAASLQ
ncbi:MAG: NAD-dependent epimerase/dehydratase family protein [Acidobacteriia bacterium]|nr:NAD-dependent epimerase/dehydratase family protein [Terriglobia bacterium]